MELSKEDLLLILEWVVVCRDTIKTNIIDKFLWPTKQNPTYHFRRIKFAGNIFYCSPDHIDHIESAKQEMKELSKIEKKIEKVLQCKS